VAPDEQGEAGRRGRARHQGRLLSRRTLSFESILDI
jgi:hypothetical protein